MTSDPCPICGAPDCDLGPDEGGDGVNRAEEAEREEGCCFPGQCCMPGPHSRSECHTAEMLEGLMSEHDDENAVVKCLWSGDEWCDRQAGMPSVRDWWREQHGEDLDTSQSVRYEDGGDAFCHLMPNGKAVVFSCDGNYVYDGWPWNKTDTKGTP